MPALGLQKVRYKSYKYDGKLHWHCDTYRLGEDEHGVWLGIPAGTVQTRGAGEISFDSEEARVKLIPRSTDTWWSALFLASPTRLDVYCDVTTPAEWKGPDEVSMIDLDLDVCRVRDGGEIFVDDEDEFAQHQVRYGYPPEVIERAAASAGWLKAALLGGAEPFRSEFRAWLERVG